MEVVSARLLGLIFVSIQPCDVFSTPLIAHWPKWIRAKNELRQRPGHLIDLMATCLDLSGADYPASLQVILHAIVRKICGCPLTFSVFLK